VPIPKFAQVKNFPANRADALLPLSVASRFPANTTRTNKAKEA
jgi:hypothetical protein